MTAKLVIEVGAQVAADITSSRFAATGDLGMELHSAIMKPRKKRRQGWASLLEVEADPRCWEEYIRWVRDNLGPYGISQGERARQDRLRSLARKAEMEIARLGKHPAYRNVAVLGHDSTLLPAWRVEGYDVLGPTPRLARAAALYADGPLERGDLEPFAMKVRGRTFTYWLFSRERVDSPA